MRVYGEEGANGHSRLQRKRKLLILDWVIAYFSGKP